MILFFTGKHLPLFFFGRSTGLSVTSTTTTSKTESGCSSAFFPGKLNRPERINVSLPASHEPERSRFIDVPALSNVKVGTVLSPIL
ncbi:hypothetical protein QUA21_22495 [Microcoleus sp. Pol1B3]